MLIDEFKQFTNNPNMKRMNLGETVMVSSKEWKDLGCNTFLEYYKENKNHIFEVMEYQDSGKRGMLQNKLLRVLKQYRIKDVLDFGAGVGADSLLLYKNGISVKYFEPNKLMRDFFRYRCQNRGIKIPILDSLEESGCIMFIYVIEHLEDPYKTLLELCNYSRYLLFTQSFGAHDTRHGGQPYHTDYKMRDIHQFLEAIGYIKIKLDGIVIPPYLYERRIKR